MSVALRIASRELYDLRRRSREAFERALTALATPDLRQLATCWQLYARPNQLRPVDCKSIWLRSCGRGEGKTRSGAEETLDLMEDWAGQYRGILLNKTLGDARKISIYGESGLMACARRRGYDLVHHRQDGIIYHPSEAQIAICTPEKPDGPRGFEFNHWWWDEIAASVHAEETFDNVIFGWRRPPPPGQTRKGTATSTPRSNAITHRLIKVMADRVTVTRGSTYDNLANLAEDFAADLELYRGTKIGRQEAEGEYLGEGFSSFDQDVIHAFRMSRPPPLARRIVSADPAINDTADSDDAGLSVLGCDAEFRPAAYLLHTEAVGSHREWPRRAARLFVEYNCDAVIAEINQGGAMIVDAIKAAADELSVELGREIVIPVRSVWSSSSKQARAEPVSALYEQGRVHHIGHHPLAEKELTRWAPGGKSPNVMDSIVQGVSHLLLGERRVNWKGYLK